jgi:hypothetical protein
MMASCHGMMLPFAASERPHLSSRKEVVRTVNAGRLVAAATGAATGSTATLLGLEHPATPAAIATTAIIPPPTIHFLLFIFVIAFMC